MDISVKMLSGKVETRGLAVTETIWYVKELVSSKDGVKPEHLKIMLGEKELPDDLTMDELRLKGYNKARPLVAHECMRITIQIPHGNTNSFSMDPKQTVAVVIK